MGILLNALQHAYISTVTIYMLHLAGIRLTMFTIFIYHVSMLTFSSLQKSKILGGMEWTERPLVWQVFSYVPDDNIEKNNKET